MRDIGVQRVLVCIGKAESRVFLEILSKLTNVAQIGAEGIARCLLYILKVILIFFVACVVVHTNALIPILFRFRADPAAAKETTQNNNLHNLLQAHYITNSFRNQSFFLR